MSHDLSTQSHVFPALPRPDGTGHPLVPAAITMTCRPTTIFEIVHDYTPWHRAGGEVRKALTML
ncbi:hypothetical protein REMIM1_PE00123 (plasmid) [Rhizobium etli bv. mimosae str. Mim1]|nr:hypothetical protein REMIM1_PE00123 [Rhizobium etli bv. mimosae str. Mim1]